MAEPTARTGVAQLRLAVEVEDLDAAVRFYRDVLGLPEELVVDSEGRAARRAETDAVGLPQRPGERP